MSGPRNWQTGHTSGRRTRDWQYRSDRGNVASSRAWRKAKLAAAGAGLVVAVGILLYLVFAVKPAPPARLVLVGVPAFDDPLFPPIAGEFDGDHADLVSLRTEAGYLFAEAPAAGSEDARSDLWNHLLTREGLLTAAPDQLRRYEQPTVVIYSGLLGYARGESPDMGSGTSRAVLVTGSDPDEHVEAAEWLRRLSRAAGERRLLVLMDTGRVDPAWDRGVLAADFASALRRDLGEEKLKNVCVLLAAGDGEQSWRFGESLAEAPAEKGTEKPEAAGKENGSQTESVGRSVFASFVIRGLQGDADGWGAKGRTDHAADKLIDTRELFSYVRRQVSDWAKRSRGATQTVQRLGGAGDFNVVAVVPPPAPTAVPEAAPAEPVKTATTSGDGGKGGKGSAPSAATKPATEFDPAAAETRLAGLWARRDEMREGVAPQVSPTAWRNFESLLLAIETRLRSGVTRDAERLLASAEEAASRIGEAAAAVDLAKRFGGSWQRPFLNVGGAPPSEPQSRGASKTGAVDGKAATPAEPPVPVTEILAQAAATPPPEGEQPSLPDRPEVRSEAIRWLVAEAGKADQVDRWAGLGRAADLVPAGDLSPEVRMIRRFAKAATAWPGPEAWPAGDAARTVRLAEALGKTSLDAPAALLAADAALTDGLTALAAAQRWLTSEAAGSGQAVQWLNRAEQRLKEAGQVAEQVAQARRVREELATELSALAEWAAERREAEPAGDRDDRRYEEVLRLAEELQSLAGDANADRRIGELFQSAGLGDFAVERSLARLFVARARLDMLLAPPGPDGAGAASTGTNAVEIGDLLSAIERNRADLNVELDRAEADALRGEATWREVESLLRLSWLPGPVRHDLRQRLVAQEVRRDEPVARRWEPGVWRGFWAIWSSDLTYGIAAQNRDALWGDWRTFVETVDESGRDESSQDAASAARLRLGARLRDLPVQSSAVSSDEDVVARRREAVGQIVGLFADAEDLASRATGGDSVRARWTTALATGHRPDSKPVLTRPDDGLKLTAPAIEAAGGGPVALPLAPGRSDRRLLIAADDAELLQRDRPVGADPVTAEAGPDLALRFRRALVEPRAVAIALLDQEGFPLDIRRLRILPPFERSRWRVRFLHVASNEILDDQVGFLDLAASVVPTAIVPVLTYPASASAGKVTVEVSRWVEFPSTGRAGWQATGLSQEFPLADGKEYRDGLRQLPLKFVPAAPANPEAPPAGGASPTPALPTQIGDFSDGLLFRLRVEKQEPIELAVLPTVIRAERIVAEPTVRLEPGSDGQPPRISVTVPPARKIDRRLPKTVPLRLEFDHRVRPLLGSQQVTSVPLDLAAGEPARLSSDINPLRIEEFEDLAAVGFEVTLSVGGLPRAYRWRLKTGEPDGRLILPFDRPVELEPIRPAGAAAATAAQAGAPAPPTGPVSVPREGEAGVVFLSSEEARDVSVRAYVGQLLTERVNPDAAVEDATPAAWTLAGTLAEAGDSATGQPAFATLIQRDLDMQTTATLADGVWQVATATGPYVEPLTLAGRKGRFVLTVGLRPAGAESPKEPQARLPISIDDSPPLPLGLSSSKAQGGQVAAAKPFDVTFRAEDRESGIRSLEIWFDADGDAALSEKDLLVDRSTVDPWRQNGPAALAVDIAPGDVPKTAERVTFWGAAVNGRGQRTVTEPLRLKLWRPAPKPETPKPTTGTLVVTFKPDPRSFGKAMVAIEGPKKLDKQASGGRAVFDDLPPGDYTVSVTQGTINKKTSEGSGTVKVGETATVSVESK